MNQEKDYLQDLAEIRSMMEKSTRFISLSGLSGVFIGIVALLGAGFGYHYIEDFQSQLTAGLTGKDWYAMIAVLEVRLLIIALLVLIVALLGGYYFTSKKAKRLGQKVWTKSTRQLLINVFIPLVTGGLFCMSMYYHRVIGFIAPSMLIFYGLALVNSSKYTLNDIRYLGVCEIVLGLIALFFVGYGLYFWAVGFGVLHIIYGVSMYYKYDREK